MSLVLDSPVAGTLTEELLGTGEHSELLTLRDTLHPRARHRRFPRSLRATASRQRTMTVTVVDQAASSASNFGVAYLVAHYTNAHNLGIFAIVSTTYIITQGMLRSLTSDCLLTRHDPGDDVMEVYERSGYLSAIGYAILASLFMLVLASLFSAELRLTFIILAVCFPLMAAQDYGRYVGISRYNPAYAVWLDMAWLILFIIAFEVLRHQHHLSLGWIWGTYCATGALVGLYAARNHVTLRGAGRQLAFWFRSERHVGMRFAGQWMLASSWAYAAIYLFVLIFSLAVIGEFKLAQVAFGPVTVMSQGIVTGMVAMAARYFQVDVRKTLRFVMLGGLLTAGVMLAWTAAIYFTPVHTLTKALGSAWPAARQLVPLTGLAFALNGIMMSAVAGLRSLRAASENLRLAIIMTPVLAGCTMIGGVVWGVQAAIAGVCIGYAIYAVVAWTLLVRIAHRIKADGAPVPGDDATLTADTTDVVEEASIEAGVAG
jgi:hypothetical protein